MIAKRMSLIDSSGIRKVFELAANLENPINLSIGQPDFDVPDPVKEEAVRQIQAGFNRYTVTQGIPELHDAFKDYYKQRFGVELENTLVTSGASGGILLSFMVLFEPGDEVLVPDPYFVMYPHLIRIVGATPVFFSTYPDFVTRAEELERAVSDRTKAIMINSPTNPTGHVMSEDELRTVAEFAQRHNLLVISDEIYEQFSYDMKPHCIAQFHDRVLVLHGLSKLAAMTGWRVGFAAGPAEIITQMTVLQQYSFVCAPSFAQKAGIVALKQDVSEKIEAYRRKRDMIYDGLKEKFNVVKPGGAFYIFPEAPGGDADRFVPLAIENNVLIIPGNVFSERNTHFRISYAADDDTLRKGIEVLNRLA